MNKFKFSLAKMRDYKRQILDSEKSTLMRLNNEKNALEDEKDSLLNELDAVGYLSENEMRKGTTAMKLKMFEMRKESIRHEVKELNKQISVLEASIERQRKVVITFSQEISGLDKLEQQQLTEYNRLLAKESEEAVEQFVIFKLSSEKQAVPQK